MMLMANTCSDTQQWTYVMKCNLAKSHEGDKGRERERDTYKRECPHAAKVT